MHNPCGGGEDRGGRGTGGIGRRKTFAWKSILNTGYP
jgi:hypothetical protein